MSDLQKLSDAMADAASAAGAGVARVKGRRRMAASGIVWADDLIVTASHVISREERLRVGIPGEDAQPAELVGRDRHTDLAVIRLETGLTPLVQAKSEPRVGQLALALARPSDHIQATVGIVSALGSGQMKDVIQTDVLMYPGFSGGPLIDVNGNLLGMNTSGFMRGASIAVGLGILERVVNMLTTHGRMRQGFLGIGAQPAQLPQSLAESVGQETGLLIAAIEPDSPAEQGGMLLGDVLITLDGQPTSDLDVLLGLLNSDRIGTQASVKIVRAGQLKDLTVTIGEKP